MKAKELKQLRKTLARANRVDNNPLDSASKHYQTIEIQKSVLVDTSGENANEVAAGPEAAPAQPSTQTTEVATEHLVLEFSPSANLTEDIFKTCLDIFVENMGEYYKNSSWGLDLQSKAAELRHEKARFLLIRNNDKDKELAGFVHFRFENDDDDNPTQAVLYVYEIQISMSYQRMGIGRKIMNLIEEIGQNADMAKVVLTAFKSNPSAMRFYTDVMNYSIDESSPSKFNEVADYEILSKKLLPPAADADAVTTTTTSN